MCKSKRRIIFMEKLKEMINSFSESMTILNQRGYEKQSLTLFFTYLDQLGWLTSSTEFSDGSDFCNWIDTYCDLTAVSFTSIDLWNARCAHLHMGAAEHKYFNSNKHFRLAFYQNISLSDKEISIEEKNYPKPTKLVDTFALYNCVNNGIDNFLQAIELDATLKSSVLGKCEKMNNLYILNK